MNFERKLNAAVGYLNLDLPDDAMAELNSMTTEELKRADVLLVRAAIRIRLKEWASGLEDAEKLLKLVPLNPAPYLDAAYCLHELNRTEEARTVLLSGPESMLGLGTYYYNLACYSSQLGDLEEAKGYLNRAIELEPEYQGSAGEDPDLAPLREAGML